MDIEQYKRKFEEYPSDLVEFATENDLKLLSLTSMRGQALALMSQPEIRGQKFVSREEAEKFFDNIEMKSRDAIQNFNKSFGLKRIDKRGFYCLKFPFEIDAICIDKRKGAIIRGDRNEKINYIKNWWRENLVDVPNEKWQIGHKDPTIGDASERNLAYQPPIQSKYRDRFKYDNIFHKMWPTASELIRSPDKYYTKEEQEHIYDMLKQKFES